MRLLDFLFLLNQMKCLCTCMYISILISEGNELKSVKEDLKGIEEELLRLEAEKRESVPSVSNVCIFHFIS